MHYTGGNPAIQVMFIPVPTLLNYICRGILCTNTIWLGLVLQKCLSFWGFVILQLHILQYRPSGRNSPLTEALNWGQTTCSYRVQQDALLLWKSAASSGRRNKRGTKTGITFHLPTSICISKCVSLQMCKSQMCMHLLHIMHYWSLPEENISNIMYIKLYSYTVCIAPLNSHL